MDFVKTVSLSKSRFFKLLLLIFLFLMLLNPSSTFTGAKTGLLLWFDTLLPTLLPFIIISSLIVRLHIAEWISRILYPFLHPILPISQNGGYPFFIGFLSGMPVGAKTTADCVRNGMITKQEGQYLLAMCNNASPMFLLGYTATVQIKNPKFGPVLCILLYLSAIVSATIFFRITKKSEKKRLLHKNRKYSDTTSDHSIFLKKQGISADCSKTSKFQFTIIDDAIFDGFETITKIGGYVILFSVLAQLVLHLSFLPDFISAFFTGILEITTGVNALCSLSLEECTKIILLTFVTSLGGLSGLAQTKSVIDNSGLSIRTYFLTKFFSAVLAVILCFLYLSASLSF